jgi:hypothetical protein
MKDEHKLLKAWVGRTKRANVELTRAWVIHIKLKAEYDQLDSAKFFELI